MMLLPMTARDLVGWVPMVVVLSCTVVSAQEPLFTSRVDLVHLGVSVMNADGEPVAELTREDFELYEDGEAQEIQYFSRGLATDAETIPLHLGVLLDASGSMEREARFAQTGLASHQDVALCVADQDVAIRVAK